MLLERGSEWVQPVDDKYGLTSDGLYIPEGVTVGAYGEGPKPVIRGDIPDVASLKEKIEAKGYKVIHSVRFS